MYIECVCMWGGVCMYVLIKTILHEYTRSGVLKYSKNNDDVVAVVEETSTHLQPKILRVMKKEVLLAWLKPTKKAAKTGYSMVVGTDTWIESTAALIYPIDVEWDGSSHMYLLHSDPVQIHKALNSSGP